MRREWSWRGHAPKKGYGVPDGRWRVRCTRRCAARMARARCCSTRGAHRAPHGVLLAVFPGNPAAGQIAWRELDRYPVAQADADVVLAHLAAQVGEHDVSAVQLDVEIGVRQRVFDD